MKKKRFEKELAELEFELAKLQETVARKGLKAAILFEGRDARAAPSRRSCGA